MKMPSPATTTMHGVTGIIVASVIAAVSAIALLPSGFAAPAAADSAAAKAGNEKAPEESDESEFDLSKLKTPEILTYVRKLDITRKQRKDLSKLTLDYLLTTFPKLKELKGKPKAEAKAEMLKIVGGFNEAVKGVLTKEQIAKLAELKAAAAENAGKVKAAAAAALEKAKEAKENEPKGGGDKES